MIDALYRLKIPTKLYLLTGVLILGLILYALLSFFTLQAIKIKGPYYEKIIQSKDVIADILPTFEIKGKVVIFLVIVVSGKWVDKSICLRS